MSFNEVIFEQNIIGVTIGTIAGYAITNLIKDINIHVIYEILRLANIEHAGLLAALVEFLLLILIVYLIYYFVLYPIFKDEIHVERKREKRDAEWKKDLLKQVKRLDLFY